MAATVYALCFLTSIACAVLLLRSYRRRGARIVFWTGLCFVGMALNNLALFVDRVLLPGQDLYWFRTLPLLLGVVSLLYGLIWEAE